MARLRKNAEDIANNILDSPETWVEELLEGCDFELLKYKNNKVRVLKDMSEEEVLALETQYKVKIGHLLNKSRTINYFLENWQKIVDWSNGQIEGQKASREQLIIQFQDICKEGFCAFCLRLLKLTKEDCSICPWASGCTDMTWKDWAQWTLDRYLKLLRLK